MHFDNKEYKFNLYIVSKVDIQQSSQEIPLRRQNQLPSCQDKAHAMNRLCVELDGTRSVILPTVVQEVVCHALTTLIQRQLVKITLQLKPV